MAFVLDIPVDYPNKQSFCYHDVFLWQSDNIYVMDNHKSALWCWMQQCDPNEQYNFMHIDRHYDMLDCFKDEDLPVLNREMSFDEYSNAKRNGAEYKVLRWDNYIQVGYALYPGWFSSAILITQKEGDAGYRNRRKLRFIEQPPIDMLFWIGQYLSEASEGLYGIEPHCAKKKWIVSLDLDVFFSINDGNVRIFSDDYIRLVAKKINMAMPNIQVLTIAISPDCLPGDENEDLYENWCQGFHVLDVMSHEISVLKELVDKWRSIEVILG